MENISEKEMACNDDDCFCKQNGRVKKEVFRKPQGFHQLRS